MGRAKLLQEKRKMVFEDLYGVWQERRLTQEEAARILGVCPRTFRRLISRYEDTGMDGLDDQRVCKASHRRAPVDEVMALVAQYKERHLGWSAKHFYAWYRRGGGQRSYTWVKCRLQEKGLIVKAPGRGKHRKHRQRCPWPGMMLHQDGSTHEWVKGVQWDLIMTMDDANSENYSLFFVEQEGTLSSFRGIKEVIKKRGLFSSLYTDRGTHYWVTPETGGKVDKVHLTHFGQAMKRLGIHMIPAYSPEARGRCERMFSTHQQRLPKELALAGITDMEQANRYISDVYLPTFNEEFMQPCMEEGSAFIAYIGTELDDVLSEQHERVVGKDNCVSFAGMKLQIPADQHRFHYVKVTVRIHRYQDRTLAIFHGPRRLARYNGSGEIIAHVESVTNGSMGLAL